VSGQKQLTFADNQEAYGETTMEISSLLPMVNDPNQVALMLERFLPEPFAGFARVLGNAKEDVMVDIAPEYRELLEHQLEVQTQMQQVTFMSNIERANHETRMAPVRNIRGA